VHLRWIFHNMFVFFWLLCLTLYSFNHWYICSIFQITAYMVKIKLGPLMVLTCNNKIIRFSNFVMASCCMKNYKIISVTYQCVTCMSPLAVFTFNVKLKIYLIPLQGCSRYSRTAKENYSLFLRWFIDCFAFSPSHLRFCGTRIINSQVGYKIHYVILYTQ
jgi:hypothetical protein